MWKTWIGCRVDAERGERAFEVVEPDALVRVGVDRAEDGAEVPLQHHLLGAPRADEHLPRDDADAPRSARDALRAAPVLRPVL